MSEHHQFIFPRDFHLPPPDWKALEAQLLQGGYALPARGEDIPYSAGCDDIFDEDDASWHSVQYCLGTAARPYLSAAVKDDYDADPRNFPIRNFFTQRLFGRRIYQDHYESPLDTHPNGHRLEAGK